MPWEWPVGAVCAFALALIATPAGVSGAVLLLPIQLSVLHVPSPAVTPTNLLFNIAAVPGGLLRFWHEHRLLNTLTGLLVAGTLPGVIARRGHPRRTAVRRPRVRAGCCRGASATRAVARARQPADPPPASGPSRRTQCAIWSLSLAVGTVGGIYGVGGGSLLAPILIAAGFSAYEVAPATLTTTFLTSIAGIITYQSPTGHPRRHDRARLGTRSVPRRWRVSRQLLRRATSKPAARTHPPATARNPRVRRRRPLHPDRRRANPGPRAHTRDVYLTLIRRRFGGEGRVDARAAVAGCLGVGCFCGVHAEVTSGSGCGGRKARPRGSPLDERGFEQRRVDVFGSAVAAARCAASRCWSSSALSSAAA